MSAGRTESKITKVVEHDLEAGGLRKPITKNNRKVEKTTTQTKEGKER